MHLPWIQADKDGLEQCKLLARLLAIPEGHGVGIGVMLWEFALRIAPEGDFAGKVPDPGIVAAAVGWDPADASRLIDGLVRVGLVAIAPEMRVRGLERYRRAWEKNQRKSPKPATSGARVPETGTNPAPPAPVPARQTQKQKQKQKKQQQPPDPRHTPLKARLAATFEQVMGAKYPSPNHSEEGAAINALLARMDPDDIDAAWRRALRASFPTVRTVAGLQRNLAHFVGAAPPSGQRELGTFTSNSISEGM